MAANQVAVAVYDPLDVEGTLRYDLFTGHSLEGKNLEMSPDMGVQYQDRSLRWGRRQYPAYTSRDMWSGPGHGASPWVDDDSWLSWFYEGEVPVIRRHVWGEPGWTLDLEPGDGRRLGTNSRILDDQGVYYVVTAGQTGLLAIQIDGLPAPNTMCVDYDGCNPQRDHHMRPE